jgi:hypothetical protein
VPRHWLHRGPVTDRDLRCHSLRTAPPWRRLRRAAIPVATQHTVGGQTIVAASHDCCRARHCTCGSHRFPNEGADESRAGGGARGAI